MSDWKSKASFVGETNYTEHRVGDKDYKFYPVRVSTMFKLRRVALPLAKALAALFKPRGSFDSTIVERTLTEEDGAVSKEVRNEAIEPELAKIRTDERVLAISELVEAFTDETNAAILGDIIVDSLREVYDAGKNNPPGHEVIKAISLPTLKDLLIGVAKANKEVLGPLADRAQAEIEALGKLQETAGSSSPTN